MRSLSEYINEAEIDFEDIIKLSKPEDCREALKKLDRWIEDNGYVYFISDGNWPGNQAESYGLHLEKAMECCYIHIDGKYAHTECDLRGIGCNPSKGCLYLRISWGDKMINWYGYHEETLPVYILAGEAAKIFRSENLEPYGRRYIDSFEQYPQSQFAKHAGDTIKAFGRIVCAKKNLAKFTESEIENILKG